jgi:raffinose/stachyose/melibiose transport system substrate-binding protein
MRRRTAAVMATILAATLGATPVLADELSVFNSKSEIEEQMEDMASDYSDENDVDMEVYYSQDTVAAHLSTKYASKDPYVLSMVDAKDIYSLGPDHALDLSDQPWVKDSSQIISIDGKVMGFPVCIEARGVIYTADAIKKITGEDFDPASVKTLDDFDALCQKLVDGGMEAPTGIMKEDWSLAAHYLQEVYEEREDPSAFVKGLHDGTVDLAKDEKFNSLMDTFDVLMK